MENNIEVTHCSTDTYVATLIKIKLLLALVVVVVYLLTFSTLCAPTTAEQGDQNE